MLLFKREVFDGSVEYVSMDAFLPGWQDLVNHSGYTGKYTGYCSYTVERMYQNARLLLAAGF